MNKLHFDSLDSTNSYLKRNYQSLNNMTFVSANYQTFGKGRNNRRWESEDNNLLFSVLIKDKKLIQEYACISVLSAYSILSTLKKYGLNDLSIKWPNDVYVSNSKICGILLESITKSDIECLIIGVGVNVNQKNFKDVFHATSMSNELGIDVDLNKFKNDVYEKLIDNFNKLRSGYDYYDEIQEYDYLKDKEVYALINNNKELVRVKGMINDYSLSVLMNGKEYKLFSGEVSFSV